MGPFERARAYEAIIVASLCLSLPSSGQAQDAGASQDAGVRRADAGVDAQAAASDDADGGLGPGATPVEPSEAPQKAPELYPPELEHFVEPAYPEEALAAR